MYNTIQLFSDPEFKKGFLVHGPRHEDGYVGSILLKSDSVPEWRVAQWASRHELSSGEIKSDAAGYEAQTVTQLVRVDYTERGSILRL